MPVVRVKESEPFDVALRRFKRACEKAGILSETRRREFYEKPTQERKRKAAAAVKRYLKKSLRENPVVDDTRKGNRVNNKPERKTERKFGGDRGKK